MEKKFRVAEIFGPTIQGEGRHAGSPCHFVRFGGCDFRCSWCDTPHAVLPEEVAKLGQMTAGEIAKKVKDLPGHPQWVVLSGGNPALLDLKKLVGLLFPMSVMIETQGTVWQDWLLDVEEVCISPKPPSSGTTGFNSDFLLKAEKELGNQFAYLKVVVFDDTDYEWAVNLHKLYPAFEFFLSVGNEDKELPTVSNPNPRIIHASPRNTRDVVLEKTAWLFEKVASDERMRDVRVMPQLHTLAWGNERGR